MSKEERHLQTKIRMFEDILLRTKNPSQVAIATDAELSSYILKGVTEGWSYDILKARLNIPCCKDVYYNLYRRFFWLLNKARD